ncbi:hypothetical protein [Paenibacillus sp. GSMTC-2017]|nr:hypothetical protein [Paenibacillus sp. GSMTC-2017]
MDNEIDRIATAFNNRNGNEYMNQYIANKVADQRRLIKAYCNERQ